MRFLGIDIGNNVTLSYQIELPPNGKKSAMPPLITLSARRSDPYLVLSGDPVSSAGISHGTVIDRIEEEDGPDGVIGKGVSIIKGNTEVNNCICIGYMLLAVTMRTTVREKREVPPGSGNWTYVETPQDVSDFIVTTAYNVVRNSNNEYQVHEGSSNSNLGGQVHSEQICAYRLKAFFDYLKTVRVGRVPAFNFDNITVRGQVRFSGKNAKGSALTQACQGCEGVWGRLRETYRCLNDVVLESD